MKIHLFLTISETPLSPKKYNFLVELLIYNYKTKLKKFFALSKVSYRSWNYEGKE